jgi:D-aminopeptidase
MSFFTWRWDSGLATRLHAKSGDSLTLLSHTYDGVVDAIVLDDGDGDFSGRYRGIRR